MHLNFVIISRCLILKAWTGHSAPSTFFLILETIKSNLTMSSTSTSISLSPLASQSMKEQYQHPPKYLPPKTSTTQLLPYQKVIILFDLGGNQIRSLNISNSKKCQSSCLQKVNNNPHSNIKKCLSQGKAPSLELIHKKVRKKSTIKSARVVPELLKQLES